MTRAGRFLTDCVELAYRLPRLWAAVQQGLVAGWRARWIAETTLALSMDAAAYVDEQVFWCASRVTPSQLGRLVEEARVRHMPEEVEKTLAASADKRHVTFDTEQCSFDGTMHLEANLEIPDALALAKAVASGAEHLARLGSGDTIDGRRATALGDLARHQLTLGFDDPDDTTAPTERHRRAARDGAAGGQAGDPDRAVRPPVRRRDHPLRQTRQPGVPGEVLCGRIEQANQRLVTAEQIRLWCGRPDVHVVVKQVIDLRERLECRGYEPDREDPRARHRPRRHVRVPVVRTQRPALRPRPHRPLRPRPSRGRRTRPPRTTWPRCADATTG